MVDQTVNEDRSNMTHFKYKYKLSLKKLAKPKLIHVVMYGLKIAGTDKVSFGSVP